VQRRSTPLKTQPLFGVKGVRGICWQVHRASAEGLVCLGSAAGVSENFSSGCARCTGVHACAQQRLLCGPVTQAQHCDRGNTCAQGGCGLRRSGQAPCRACAARQQERGADAGRAGGGERLEERRGPVLGAPADQVPVAACGRDLVLVAPPERCLRQHCGLTSFCPLLTPKVQRCVPGVLFLLAARVTQARQRTERPAGVLACRARLPRMVHSWLRNYVAVLALYFAVGGVWSYYIYWCFGSALFAPGAMPGVPDVVEQIKACPNGCTRMHRSVLLSASRPCSITHRASCIMGASAFCNVNVWMLGARVGTWG